MPSRRKKRSRLPARILILALALIIVAGHAFWRHNNSMNSGPAMNQTKKGQNSVSTTPFNKNQYPTNKSSSLWAVVNKGNALPANYAPTHLITPSIPLRLVTTDSEMHLRQEAASALEELFAGASAQGLYLMLASGYRSYQEQVMVYGNEVENFGQVVADSESARPGHSEHQTGLAADVEPASRQCELLACFGDTPEGHWLAANASRYGFIIRYQKNQKNQTGYQYEPWHIRFIGQSLAAEVYRSGQTLEQFFKLPPYITYPAQSGTLKV